MRHSLVLLACLASGCTGSSTAPTRSTAGRDQPASGTATLSGHVTATNGGQALAGLALVLGPQTAISDAAGAFSVALSAPSTYQVTMNGGAIVPRSTYVAVNATRDVAIDAIAVAGFDLGFYRQLVRNAHDAPGTLQPLRRWTRAPQIYIRTIDDAGAAVPAVILDTTERTIRETAPMWTSGAFGVAGVTRGSDTRIGQAGWITVHWPGAASTDVCGRADVAVDGGMMQLDYLNPACRCNGPDIRARSVRHELGHSLGFWHTDSVSDVMAGVASVECDALPSARELVAAAVAYRRPIGNTDPDADPSSTINLQPMTAR